MAAKQDDLSGVEGPGVSPAKFKDVDEAFDTMLGARTNRMKWGKKEVEAQASLLEIMHKRDIEVYYFDDQKYVRKQLEKVVRAPKDDNGEED